VTASQLKLTDHLCHVGLPCAPSCYTFGNLQIKQLLQDEEDVRSIDIAAMQSSLPR
jgi:hypothetical protein